METTNTTTLPVVNTGYERKKWWQYVQIALDSLSWSLALPLGFFLRYGGQLEQINPTGITVVVLTAIIVQIGLGALFGLYRGRYSYGSFAEGKILYPVTLAVTVFMLLALLLFAWHISVPRSVILIAFPFALLLMMVMRYLKRIVEDYTNRPSYEHTEPVIVYGGGFVGRSFVSNLMSDSKSTYRPVAIVDDDPSLRNARIQSVAVMGTGKDLETLVKRYHATKVFVAMTDIKDSKLSNISQRMHELGVDVHRVKNMISNIAGLNDESVKDVNRHILEGIRGKIDYQIRTEDIKAYITGKRVLVTGAGGSIGSELCRQIHEFEPAELMMLDRDETLLMETRYTIWGDSNLNDPSVVLADIRDRGALEKVFTERQPEVVFHAAALKHVTALEAYPEEAWKTNTLGTKNVLEAASKVNVEAFVNISTDKAADPTTALGQSKLSAEMLTAWYGEQTGKRYVSVRFGNVFGSRGSIKPLFTRQIMDGGPITVTDPDATRYFMLIPDACLLVMTAGAIGAPGEVMVLDMGKPVKIYSVAENLIRTYERYDVNIAVTGLRPGEKRDEVLFGSSEDFRVSDKNSFISHTRAIPLDPEHLDYSKWYKHYLDDRTYGRDSSGQLHAQKMAHRTEISQEQS
ncbi:nucleoside-diphosphate sugar epimerase/dehydratase [Rothia sp. ZJ932]|uniref:nucleoside-diphosphate sugar epimerase/dehydratase n=1 Tax=Rothia sp. ZJ932 TaxID=2810516 RepID=UPI001967912B|nr:nucleoside-diphosphate sugar epimerase/dehydratase [Rothia sp. ZJ932]QRZ62274.1 polysaccharide biosynthesis protein [Rothia sp. ZJ932]